jgi:cysteine synthase
LSRGVLDLVGNTPIIKLHNVVPNGAAEVWLKFESSNKNENIKMVIYNGEMMIAFNQTSER